MCRSRAQGGQRCHSHAHAAAERAVAALSAALNEEAWNPSPDATAAVVEATAALRRAQVDLASTSTGREALERTMANPLMQSNRVEQYRQILDEGEALRDRNSALRTAHADITAGRSPLATGTNARLDQSIAEAHRIVAEHMGTARTPTAGVRNAKVKTYRSAAEQQRGLAARLRTLGEAEFDFANLNRQVRAHTSFNGALAGLSREAGLPEGQVAPSPDSQEQLAGLTAMRDAAAVRLVILADRYAKAKAQRPPARRMIPFAAVVLGDGPAATSR